MTRYRVLLSRTAVRQFNALVSAEQRRLRERLLALQEDPFTARPGVDIRPLRARADPSLYRLRSGEYRALYFVLKGEVRITEILHRSVAYRGLE